MYLHPVLRESTGLVGTYYCCRSHCLACVHPAHKVVCLEHTVHTQGQAKRYGHWQPFGHRHYNERNSNHKVVQHIRHNVHCRHIAKGEECLYRQERECDTGCSIAQFAYHAGKTVQLNLQRSLYPTLNLRSFVHLAIFRCIANALHSHNAIAVNDCCAAQHPVRGVCGLIIEIGLNGCLCNYRFTCECRLVYLQRLRLQQHSIGRHLVTSIQQDNIAHYNLLTRNLKNLAVTLHRHHHVVVDSV